MTCQGIDIFNLNLIHIIGIDIFFMFKQLSSQVNCCKTNWSLSDCSFYNSSKMDASKSFVFESWKKRTQTY